MTAPMTATMTPAKPFPPSYTHDYLTQLERLGSAAALPRVKALHLPPREAADGARAEARGEFCALELADGTLGLAYVLLDDTHGELAAASWRHDLAGSEALDLVRAGFAAPGGALRSAGHAAAAALTRWCFDRAGFVPPASGDSVGALQAGPGERVGMIGLFGPLIDRLLARGVQLTVLELRADLLDARPGLEVTLDPARLRGCQKVICTSTVLLNDTLDAVLAACADARWLAMLGPGAGCLPDGLFARGVTALGGTWITDGPAYVAGLVEGRPAGAAARKFTLTPADYPGFDALLGRLPGRG